MNESYKDKDKDKYCWGTQKIFEYLTPKCDKTKEIKKFTRKIREGCSCGRDFYGYVNLLLNKYPIDSSSFDKLERKYLGIEEELDVAANFDIISVERQEFYACRTEKRKKVFSVMSMNI